MPCDTTGHDHPWPQSGLLALENCERYCGYCSPSSVKPRGYVSTASLKQHVRRAHTAGDRSHPNVELVIRRAFVPYKYRTRFAPAYATPAEAENNNEPQACAPQTSAIQNAVSVNPLVISTDPLTVMRDIHEQLHLQPLAVDAFHLFVWRHILSKQISNLHGLAREVKSDSSTIPKDLLVAIVTLLNGCGDIIWPTHAASRHHLTSDSRLLQQGYWDSLDSSGAKSGPVWLTDGFMSAEMRRKWQEQGDNSEPPRGIIVVYSPLGCLLSVYVCAMLQHSVVDPSGYERAAGADTAELLWQIVAADAEGLRQGPLGAMMLADKDDQGNNEEAYEDMMARYCQETGGRGGLPFSEVTTDVIDLT